MLCDLMQSDDMYPTSKRNDSYTFHSILPMISVQLCCALFSCFDFDWLLFFSPSFSAFKREFKRAWFLDFHAKRMAIAVVPTRCEAKQQQDDNDDNGGYRKRHFNLKKLSVKHVPFRYSIDIMSYWFFRFTGKFCYFQIRAYYWMELYRLLIFSLFQ